MGNRCVSYADSCPACLCFHSFILINWREILVRTLPLLLPRMFQPPQKLGKLPHPLGKLRIQQNPTEGSTPTETDASSAACWSIMVGVMFIARMYFETVEV